MSEQEMQANIEAERDLEHENRLSHLIRIAESTHVVNQLSEREAALVRAARILVKSGGHQRGCHIKRSDIYPDSCFCGWDNVRVAIAAYEGEAGGCVDPRIAALERQNAALHAVAAWVLDVYLTGHAPCCATNQGPYPCDCGFVEAQKLIDACRASGCRFGEGAQG